MTVAPVERPRLSAPPRDAHKYTRGMVVVIGGAMPGAAELAAAAALRSGAGYVLLAAPTAVHAPPHAIVRKAVPDPAGLAELLADERIGAVVIGPGLGRDRDAEARLAQVLACGRRLVIDGDALTLLTPDSAIAGSWLTPHAGEFDWLFPDLTGDKPARTLAAAARAGATVVHKGADTFIASPDGRVRVLSDAPSWLSTAGTGDVLAGILAAQVAAGVEDPADTAVWLHATAGTLAGPAFAADDLIPLLPQAIAQCLN